MREPEYSCPICSAELPYFSRYPHYICSSCVRDVADENGRALRFFNTHAAGGFEGVYTDTDEKYEGNECFVRGKRCYADEAYMGGIVVELLDSR